MMPISAVLSESKKQLLSVSDVPGMEAEVLLAAVLNVDRCYLYTRAEQLITEIQYDQLFRMIEQRQKGKPIAYLLGEKEFWSLLFLVSQDVLIPRPETELLVEKALSLFSKDDAIQVLELGTGSGAIAIALGTERPFWKIDATDISPAALAIAEKNAQRLNCENIRFIESDWYSQLPTQRYHMIISNPPYIAANDSEIDLSVLACEPRTALIAGSSGLEALEIIISEASEYLLPAGFIVLEYGWQQAKSVCLLLETAGFEKMSCFRDLAGHDRMVIARKSSHL